MRSGPISVRTIVATLLGVAALATGQQPQRFEIGKSPGLYEAIQDIWRWVSFGPGDGLPSADVSQIVETADGTIWANTTGGVAWYSGYEWTPVSCAAAHGKSQTAIHPFDDHSLLGISAGDLTVFERSGCRTISVSYGKKPLQILSASEVHDGKMLILDDHQNYYVWDRVSGQASERLVDGADNLNNRMSKATGYPVFYSSRKGMMVLQTHGATVGVHSSSLSDANQIGGLMVRSTASDKKGNAMFSVAFPQEWIGIWEYSRRGGLKQVHETKGQVARLLALAPSGDALAVYTAAEAWIKHDGRWSPLKPIPGPMRSANNMMFDSRGRLWVATAHGIHVLRADQNQWSKLQFPFPNLKNHVNALLPTRDGKLWMGTADGMVVLSANGSIRSISTALGAPLGLVTSIVEDHEGSIWFSSGASFNGVYRYRDGEFRHFGEPDGLVAAPFHRLVTDSEGRLWALATGRGLRDGTSGVFLFDGRRFERWDLRHGLGDSRVYAIHADSQDSIWFAAVSGVYRYLNGSWQSWTAQNGLLPGSPYDIRPRRKGGVYFVDRASGLGTIDADGKLSYTRISETSAGQNGWQVHEDLETGMLWISSRGGIQLRRNQEWTSIGPTSGLENPETWPLAPWRNQVCAGTDGGGLFCLSRNVLRRPPPRVRLETPRVDGSSATLTWHVVGFEESSTNEGNLSRYRIDSGAWTPWQSRTSLTLWGLRQGNHHIDVQAIDRFGVTSTTHATQPFQIQAPLFRQPLFWVPVGVSFLAALVAIYAFVSRTYKHNRELAEKEESFRALIEYSSVGITLCDRNQRIFYVSPAVSIILGYDSKELLGDFRSDLIHPDDLTNVRARLSSLIETAGQTQRFRYRMLHRNGEYRWIETISRNLFDNPSVAAVVTNLRDITDSTTAELAAAEARKRAENANQAKSDFLAMISHEIRTPMNGITGMCQLMLESNLNREQQDYAETIAQSAQSLLALINDVLDFSRIEAGKLTIERAPIDLSNILQEVAQLMRVRALEKSLDLSVSYPADSPRAFYGDALRIRQILFNLTGNAVKFTAEGSVRISASVTYQSGSRYNVSIAVVDTGIGISEDKLQLVFQKFTQADLSTTRRYGGSGLGLSISKSLAELMGGSISASSTVAKGSEFRLELQLDAAPENSLTHRDSTVDALQPLSESLDILLVEDNKVNQKLAMRLLDRLGCTAVVATSGVEALELLDKHNFDLILMDCQMPEMDGYETTRRIREREHSHRHLPIVAITANAMESDLERCISAGMDSYLTKPIDFLKLRDALETWGIDYRAPRATSDPGAS